MQGTHRLTLELISREFFLIKTGRIIEMLITVIEKPRCKPRTLSTVCGAAAFFAAAPFYPYRNICQRYLPRSFITSARVIDPSSLSIAACTRHSLSSRILWMFFPTGQLGFGFS